MNVRLSITCKISPFGRNDSGRLIRPSLNPDAGDLIPGGRGLRKLRAGLGGQDKRGGARVIYYWRVSHEICYLIFAYAKNWQENLTPTQTRLLAAAMHEVLGDG